MMGRTLTHAEFVAECHAAVKAQNDRRAARQAEIDAFYAHWRTRLARWLRDIADDIEPPKPRALIDFEF